MSDDASCAPRPTRAKPGVASPAAAMTPAWDPLYLTAKKAGIGRLGPRLCRSPTRGCSCFRPGRRRRFPQEHRRVDRTTALIVTLFTGALVAAQPPVNALLARHVTDLGAAFVSLAFSTLIVGTLLIVVGDASALGELTQMRPVHAIAGIAGAAIVLVSLIAVRELGAGGVTAALVATQLSVSVLLDRLGVLGLDGHAVTARTVLGVALLFGGTYLVVVRA